MKRCDLKEDEVKIEEKGEGRRYMKEEKRKKEQRKWEVKGN